jgi:hypothetical protein
MLPTDLTGICTHTPSNGTPLDNFSEPVSFHSVSHWVQELSLDFLYGWSAEWKADNTLKTAHSGSFTMTEFAL